MKNFIQPGNTVTVTLTAAASSGDVVIVNNLVGIAATDGANGDDIEIQVTGVFELPKTSANTPGQFALAYWDTSAGEVTTTSTDNTLIGVFTEAYGSGTTVANVRLNGTSV